MSDSASWSIEHDVREDAESIFLPVGDLPEADLGDAVTLTAGDGAAVHHGHITEQVSDEARGEFFIVRLDEPD